MLVYKRWSFFDVLTGKRILHKPYLIDEVDDDREAIEACKDDVARSDVKFQLIEDDGNHLVYDNHAIYKPRVEYFWE